jgi:hypothetical protein
MVVDMRRRWLFGALLLALTFCPVSVACASSRNETPTLRPLTDIDVWVDTLSSYSFYTEDCKKDGRIYGSFEVTSGSDIDFFICDQTNYDLWKTGSSSVAYEINDNVGSLSYSLNLPHDDTWYVVFYNDNWFYRKHIEGTVYYAVPYTAPNSSSMGGLIVLGIIGVIVVCGGIGVHAYSNSTKKQEPQRGIPPQSQGTLVYAGPSQPSSAPRFCPSCGSPLRFPNDRFCSTCGRQLGPGPELG